MKAAGACLLALLVAGCAAVPTQPGQVEQPSREIATPSDQTEAERRARVRLELASAYYARGQTTTALDELKLALHAKPDLAEAFNLRGLIYGSLGDDQLATESFQRALQLNPRDGDTLHNFGWMLCQQGRYAEAQGQFQRALASPQYPNAMRTLTVQGICHARSGDLDGAEAALSRAYASDPANPVSGVNLAEVLYRRGEYERARFYIRRVNAVPEVVNAQTLWLAARIEHKLGYRALAESLGKELRDRFPESPEALAYEKGAIND